MHGVESKAGEAAAEGDYLSLLGRICLCLIAPLSGLAQAGLTPVLPEISAHFSSQPGADALVRLMMSSLSFMMIVGSLGAGLLAARMGQRPLLFLCLGIYAVSGAAGFFLDNIYALVASRMILGVVTAGWGVLVAAIITTKIAPGIRDRWLGFYIVSGTAGMFVLIVAVGALAKIDWRHVFLLYLIAVPMMVMLALFMRGGSSPEPVAMKADGSVLKKPVPLGLVLFSLLCGMVGPTVMIFLPFHLLGFGEGTPDRIAGLVVATAIATAVLAFAYGWLRKRLSVMMMFVIGFVLMCIGLLVIVLMRDYAGAMMGMILFGFGGGFVHPNVFAAAAATALPADRARVIGFVRGALYAGPLVAQLSLEPVFRAFGPSAPLGALAVLAAGAILFAVMGRRAYAPAG
ncbi:MAG: MFS transporter [Sphingobium sp.]